MGGGAAVNWLWFLNALNDCTVVVSHANTKAMKKPKTPFLAGKDIVLCPYARLSSSRCLIFKLFCDLIL